MVRLFIPCWQLLSLDDLSVLEKLLRIQPILDLLKSSKLDPSLDITTKFETMAAGEAFLNSNSLLSNLHHLIQNLSCGGKCGKDLKFCKHPCRSICHPGSRSVLRSLRKLGDCTEKCCEPVNIRCTCGLLKKVVLSQL